MQTGSEDTEVGTQLPTSARDPKRRSAEEMRVDRGDTIGRYVVLERLGRGGMGVVYAAFDPELDRRIALKLLRPDVKRSRHYRLVREAQAMAKLAHPNVIAVHDVGTDKERVFIAMEFVDGFTLGKWVEQERPEWRQIIEVFLQAGGGIAAAHASGMVHRDFKPDNVLVGKDGRVRVMDFGLARALGDDTASPDESSDPPELDLSELSGSALRTRLTETGAILGTPAYMSPEQHLGQIASERSDQFSFCVALYEALYGRHPYDSGDRRTLVSDVIAGNPAVPPSDSPVPPPVRDAIMVGLARFPENRHPSMEVLLSILARSLDRRRPHWTVLGATVALVGLGVLGGWVWATREDPCSGSAQRMAGVWDDDVAGRVGAALGHFDAPYAATTKERVHAELEDYARGWIEMHQETCLATWVRHEQSPEMLDRRMACLEQRRQALGAMVEVLSQPDPRTLDRALDLVLSLTPLGACEDPAALLSGADEESQGEEARLIEQELARAVAYLEAGHVEESRVIADAALEDVATSSSPSLRAKALLVSSRLDLEIPGADARARAQSALELSFEAGDSDTAARAALTLATFSKRREQWEEALRLHREAAALSRHQASDPSTEARALLGQATVLLQLSRYAEAREALRDCMDRVRGGDVHASVAVDAHVEEARLRMIMEGYAAALEKFEEARKMAVAHYGEGHPAVLGVDLNLAMIDVDRGEIETALDRFDRLVERHERTVDPLHPGRIRTLVMRSSVLAQVGRIEEAERDAKRGMELIEEVSRERGPQSNLLIVALWTWGEVQEAKKNWESAYAAYDRALKESRSTFGDDHVWVGNSLNYQAGVIMNSDPPGAEQKLREALEIYERVGVGEVSVGIVLNNLVNAIRMQGRHAEALPVARRTLETLEQAMGRDSPALAAPNYSVGVSLLELGRATEALPFLQRALDLRSRMEGEPANIDEYALGRALFESGMDTKRGLELVRKAVAAGKKRPDRDLIDAEKWLAEHAR